MKKRLILNFSLFLILLAACAPAAVTESPAQPAAPVAVEPSATPFAPSDPVQAGSTEVVPVATEEVVSTPLPVATSRGPNLEATDPRGVNLASGNLQLVEFFRFT